MISVVYPKNLDNTCAFWAIHWPGVFTYMGEIWIKISSSEAYPVEGHAQVSVTQFTAETRVTPWPNAQIVLQPEPAPKAPSSVPEGVTPIPHPDAPGWRFAENQERGCRHTTAGLSFPGEARILQHRDPFKAMCETAKKRAKRYDIGDDDGRAIMPWPEDPRLKESE